MRVSELIANLSKWKNQDAVIAVTIWTAEDVVSLSEVDSPLSEEQISAVLQRMGNIELHDCDWDNLQACIDAELG